jgi:hypothetical protein
LDTVERWHGFLLPVKDFGPPGEKRVGLMEAACRRAASIRLQMLIHIMAEMWSDVKVRLCG